MQNTYKLNNIEAMYGQTDHKIFVLFLFHHIIINIDTDPKLFFSLISQFLDALASLELDVGVTDL